ncbi:MAG: putative DCC family thiol-disulfide oxidoreductase YuxK [Candidatus Omnitrophota bacterium]|jgi:predicted DCC family thiol-disulfide oxidoreductase YuxK
MKHISKIWHTLFIGERPSLSLGLFRIAVAFTTWAHVYPSLVHLKDNYFPGAFKTVNTNFFPVETIHWIQESPEWLIVVFCYIFCFSCFTFFIGLFTQISCLAMTISCYFFYALNAFHIGTLSWDILLVNLFLMCVTSYPGDYFSVDALRKGGGLNYGRERPYFIQRLLQLNIASIFFYTALYKTTGGGNWIAENPLFNVLNYPSAGVTKTFLLKDYLINHPRLVYWIGVTVFLAEFYLPLFLFWRKTRIGAIYLGALFHVVLILTLDVPATFLFLFPAQLCLFIDTRKIVDWIEVKRQRNKTLPLGHVLFDGKCYFCCACVRWLKIMDMFQVIKFVDFNQVSDLKQYHSMLTKEKVLAQMQLIDVKGGIYSGFYAFRRLSLWLPMLWPLLLVFYIPAAGFIGSVIYGIIARNRHKLIKCNSSNTCRL